MYRARDFAKSRMKRGLKLNKISERGRYPGRITKRAVN